MNKLIEFIDYTMIIAVLGFFWGIGQGLAYKMLKVKHNKIEINFPKFVNLILQEKEEQETKNEKI